MTPKVSPSGAENANYPAVFDMVGNTPCVRFRAPGDDPPRVYLKLEGTNPTGSIKDRACLFMLREALRDGSLAGDRTLLDASSGNFGCSLALFARLMGYRSTVVVSSKVTAAKRDFLHYLGATVHQVGNFTIEGNAFCRNLVEQHPGRYHFLDQLHNWKNPEAHRLTTAPEILKAFPDVSTVVGSLGSGGAMVGIARHFRECAPRVALVAVESAGGNRIPGVGAFVDGDYETPFIRTARENGYFDEVFRITEADALQGTRQLMDQGIFCGMQTGGVIYAALKYAAARRVTGPIIVLSGDTGWKNLEKLLESRQG